MAKSNYFIAAIKDHHSPHPKQGEIIGPSKNGYREENFARRALPRVIAETKSDASRVGIFHQGKLIR